MLPEGQEVGTGYAGRRTLRLLFGGRLCDRVCVGCHKGCHDRRDLSCPCCPSVTGALYKIKLPGNKWRRPSEAITMVFKIVFVHNFSIHDCLDDCKDNLEVADSFVV